MKFQQSTTAPEYREAEKQYDQPAPPPDGGLKAWLQVVGSFFLFFNTWGQLNTFGVFQTYYESGALFRESSSNIAWIGSIQAYLVFTVALCSGPIYDRGHLRALLIYGSFMIVLGLMMLSLCHDFWEVLLAQGFRHRIGLAVGIASSGSSLGGVLYPIVVYRLISRIGFAWSVRVVGLIAFCTLLPPLLFMRMRAKPAKIRALFDSSALKDWPYLLFTLGAMFGFVGTATMLFYISFYAQNKSITDSEMAFYILPIFNAASCFGRVVPNWLSDKAGPFNLITPGAAIFGMVTFCMLAVTNTSGMVVLAMLAGFFSGVYIALPPVCFVALTTDKSKIGTRMGMGFAFCGFGLLAGGPGSGAILGAGGHLEWTGLWVFAGVCTFASVGLFLAVRVVKVGSGIKSKI